MTAKQRRRTQKRLNQGKLPRPYQPVKANITLTLSPVPKIPWYKRLAWRITPSKTH